MFAHSLICFHFMSEFFYFEINLSRTGFLTFFEYLLFFHIPFNEQILDVRYSSAFFRGQGALFFLSRTSGLILGRFPGPSRAPLPRG